MTGRIPYLFGASLSINVIRLNRNLDAKNWKEAEEDAECVQIMAEQLRNCLHRVNKEEGEAVDQ